MAKLHGYDEADKRRITAIATRLVLGAIERGEIEDTDQAIRAAMPEAVNTAKDAVNAVNDYLKG